MTTRKELLATAKTLGIKGRHEMKTEELKTKVLRMEHRPTGKVVRKGHNLSGNKPYVAKIYSCGRIIHEDQLAQEPRQVQALVKFVATTGFKGQGGQIVAAARKAGVLKTKIKDGRELFGYYAKRLQHYGVKAEYAA